MVFKQTQSSCPVARLPRKPSSLPFAKDSRSAASRIRSRSTKASKSRAQACPHRTDFARTPNRFSVLAEPDESPTKPDWTFDFIPNTTGSIQRRGRRGRKHRKIRTAALEEQNEKQSEGISQRNKIITNANNGKPALGPQEIGHVRRNILAKDGAEVLKASTENHWAPQFRPNVLPVPTTAIATSTKLEDVTFPSRPEPCLSFVNASTMHFETQEMKRRESRCFPSSGAVSPSDPILPRPSKYRFSTPKSTSTEPYHTRESVTRTSLAQTRKAVTLPSCPAHAQIEAKFNFPSSDNHHSMQQAESTTKTPVFTFPSTPPALSPTLAQSSHPKSLDQILPRTVVSLKHSLPPSNLSPLFTLNTLNTFSQPPLLPRCFLQPQYTRTWTEPSDGITIFKTSSLQPAKVPVTSSCQSVNIPESCPPPATLKDAPKQRHISQLPCKQKSALRSSSPETWQELELEKFLNAGHRSPCWCGRRVETSATLIPSNKATEKPLLLPESKKQELCKSDAGKLAVLNTECGVNTGMNASIESLSSSSSSTSFQSQSDFEDLYDETDQISQEDKDLYFPVASGDHDSSTFSYLITNILPASVAPSQTSGAMEIEPASEERDLGQHKLCHAFSSVESFQFLEEQNCESCSKCECACVTASASAVEWPTPQEAARISRSRTQGRKNDAQEDKLTSMRSRILSRIF